MKILFPIKYFYPFQNGGYSQVVYWLAKALSNQGNDVIVITTTKDLNNRYKVNEWEDVEGLKVRYCSGPLLLNIRLIVNGIKQIKECDVVHLTSIFFIPSFIFALTCIILKKKFIWSTHGELATDAISGNYAKNIYLLLIRFFSKKITFHSTSLKETKEIKHHMGRDVKIVEIPNFMEITEPLAIPKEKVMVFVGRIHPIKALDKLIQGLSLSKIFVNDEYKFFIIGDDNDAETISYVKRLKKQINELHLDKKIFFLGSLYGKKKYEFYSKAICSFLVSETENFGNVVIESLSQGTPVIASTGTPWEILKKENMGDFINNNPQNIADSLDRFLSLDIKDYKMISNHCIKWCLMNYSINDHIYIWEDVYKQI